MQPVADRLRQAMAGCLLRQPSVPYMSDRGGRALYDAEEVREDLALSVARPVRWYDALEVMRELGATVFTFKGQDVADTIMRFAREYRIGQIVIGRPNPLPWWRRLMGQRSVAEQLIHRAAGVTIVVVDAQSEESTQAVAPIVRPGSLSSAWRPRYS